ncbi:glycoside hydrolase family 78 protein, partial [Streptomyces collinus]
MTTPSFEASPATDTATKVTALRTADDSGLVATPLPEPRLSWSLTGDRPGVLQHAYEVQVAADRSFTGTVSSGEVESGAVTDHPWPAGPLGSREVRHWRVRVRTDVGWTQWSQPARVEAALLDAGDWTARPVHVPSDRGRTSPGPVPRGPPGGEPPPGPGGAPPLGPPRGGGGYVWGCPGGAVGEPPGPGGGVAARHG